jgi:AraC-like DNA-binding protein
MRSGNAWCRCCRRDPVIGRALSLLHAEPGRPWLVQDIARQAGMSRSGFAQRFLDLTGDTPGLRQRARAQQGLRRQYATTPGRYRRQHRGT